MLSEKKSTARQATSSPPHDVDDVDSAPAGISHLSLAGDTEWASSAPKLRCNLALLSPDHMELGKMLMEMEQSHLFEHWPELGVDDEVKQGFFDQIARLNASYPGGLSSYIKNARHLADSKAGRNPFYGFLVLHPILFYFYPVPKGENLTFADDDFIKYEEAGIKEAQNGAFVLVAGGLGERLGYNGIKVTARERSLLL
ncbi:UDP-sugar pyrophosphorylase-like protein [Drosera capensis]